MMEQEPPGATEPPETAAESPGTPAEPPLPPTLPPPVVAWESTPPPDAAPAEPWPPTFSIGGILSDAFARYAADPIRIFVIGLVPSVAGLLGGFLIGAGPFDFSSIGTYMVSAALVGLVALALGLISLSITFALLEGGREGSLRSAARRGLSRVGWLLATGILVALAVGGVYIAAALPVVFLFRYLGPLVFILILVAVVLVISVAMRLYPALVGVVVDQLGAGQAIRRAWAVTRPTGVWLRLFACYLLLGLVIAPVSFLGLALSLNGVVPAIVATLIGGLAVAFVAPLATTLQYSAYRRLVAPMVLAAPTAPMAPAALAAPAPVPTQLAVPETADVPGPIVAWAPEAVPPAAAPTVGFAAPPLGGRGKAFAGITIVLAIVGLVSAPVAIGSFFNRALNLPNGPFPGNVPVGIVAFGTSGNLATCTVSNQMTTTKPFSPVVFMGHLQRAATPSDEVRLVVTADGSEIVNELEKPGAFACLGTGTPESDIGAGTYLFKIFLNGQVSAQGTLVVQ